MFTPNFEKSNITPKKALQILKAKRTEVTEEEAEIILALLKIFAEMAINQVLKLDGVKPLNKTPSHKK